MKAGFFATTFAGSRVFCISAALVIQMQNFAFAGEPSVPAVTTPIAAVAPAYLARADNAPQVRAGFIHYKTYCAQCHGRNLQGQPLWHLQDANLHRRAPAQDDTGHTWQHSDEDLFQMIRTGHFPGEPNRTTSFMPAFGEHLAEADIVDIIAFIKSRWSLGIQVFQSSLNPEGAGMPQKASSEAWTLPLNCISPIPNQVERTVSR